MKLKLNYKFNEIPIKILIGYFMELGKLIPSSLGRGNVQRQSRKLWERKTMWQRKKKHNEKVEYAVLGPIRYKHVL